MLQLQKRSRHLFCPLYPGRCTAGTGVGTHPCGQCLYPQDVEGFQEEWLQCRRSDQERNIREDRKRVEQARKRLTDLDVLLSRLYEDFVLGDLNKERYKKMTADYEAEQERLKLEIEVTEEWLETQETMSADVDAFVALTQKYVDVLELTPTIVNEYSKKIEVFAPDKSSGKRVQKVKSTSTSWMT